MQPDSRLWIVEDCLMFADDVPQDRLNLLDIILVGNTDVEIDSPLYVGQLH